MTSQFKFFIRFEQIIFLFFLCIRMWMRFTCSNSVHVLLLVQILQFTQPIGNTICQFQYFWFTHHLQNFLEDGFVFSLPGNVSLGHWEERTIDLQHFKNFFEDSPSGRRTDAAGGKQVQHFQPCRSPF